jgi:hypothetical protein
VVAVELDGVFLMAESVILNVGEHPTPGIRADRTGVGRLSSSEATDERARLMNAIKSWSQPLTCERADYLKAID